MNYYYKNKALNDLPETHVCEQRLVAGAVVNNRELLVGSTQ